MSYVNKCIDHCLYWFIRCQWLWMFRKHHYAENVIRNGRIVTVRYAYCTADRSGRHKPVLLTLTTHRNSMSIQLTTDGEPYFGQWLGQLQRPQILLGMCILRKNDRSMYRNIPWIGGHTPVPIDYTHTEQIARGDLRRLPGWFCTDLSVYARLLQVPTPYQ